MAKTVKVKVKNIPSSPQKARLVADMVRGMRADQALAALEFLNKKAAIYMKKALESGIANAREVLNVTEPSQLVISKLTIDDGLRRKGYRFASKGRVGVLIKRKANINLELRSK